MASNDVIGPSGNPAGPSTSAADKINPPESYANFNYISPHGFQYTEAAFNAQLALRINGTEKYKQREAFPRPDGIDLDVWKKVFNSADSTVYVNNNYSAALSKSIRQNTHETRELAEKRLLAKLARSGEAVSTSQVATVLGEGALPPKSALNTHNREAASDANDSSADKSSQINQQPANNGVTSNQSSHNQGNQQPATNEDNSNKSSHKQSSKKNNSRKKGQTQANKSSTSIEANKETQPAVAEVKMASQSKKSKNYKEYCVCKQLRHGVKMMACDGGLRELVSRNVPQQFHQGYEHCLVLHL